MGQKTNPIGNRLGIIRGWESNWYGGNDFGDKLAEDAKIRKYLMARLSKASVSKEISCKENPGCENFPEIIKFEGIKFPLTMLEPKPFSLGAI